MDATQKRRMWKVAISHFVLTALIIIGTLYTFLLPFYQVKGEAVAWHGSHDSYIWALAWQKVLAFVLFLLQPQFWPWFKVERLEFPYLICSLALIPLWSICFGWLFVRLDNWLNHFPVLGRKVF
jgi:hypothetical protein